MICRSRVRRQRSKMIKELAKVVEVDAEEMRRFKECLDKIPKPPAKFDPPPTPAEVENWMKEANNGYRDIHFRHFHLPWLKTDPNFRWGWKEEE